MKARPETLDALRKCAAATCFSETERLEFQAALFMIKMGNAYEARRYANDVLANQRRREALMKRLRPLYDEEF